MDLINYFKSFKRYIQFNSKGVILSIIGLIIGVSSFMTLLAFFLYENSYDQFLEGHENIYRVTLEKYKHEEFLYHKAGSVYAIGPLMKESIPEVTEFVRCGFERGILVKDNEVFNHQPLFYADTSFFDVLPLPLIHGSKETALEQPYSVVLSQRAAKRFFGDQNPVGQTIDVNYAVPCKVTGVFEDLPDNSHFDFEMILSLSTGDVFVRPGWGAKNQSWSGEGWMYTYVSLQPGVSPGDIEQKIKKVVAEHFPQALKDKGLAYHYHLQPLSSIHLNSTLEGEFKPNGNKFNLYVIFSFGLIILLISWINYINISTAELIENYKKINVRRVLGASRNDLITQFLFNGFLIHLFSVIVGGLISWQLVNLLGPMVQKHFSIFEVYRPYGYYVILLLPIVGLLVTSSYPILMFSSLKSIQLSKGAFSFYKPGTKFEFRAGLLVFQLAMAVFLIVSLLSVYNQLDFIQSKDLGYNRENILSAAIPISLNGDSLKYQKFKSFKNDLERMSKVVAVSPFLLKIGDELKIERGVTKFEGDALEDVRIRLNKVDEDFHKVLGIEILSGKSFDKNYESNRGKVIISKKTVDLLGFDKPSKVVGQIIHLSNNEGNKESIYEVIGVVSDYHHESLRESIKPMLYVNGINKGFGSWAVRIESGNTLQTIQQINQVYKKHFPSDPFDYEFTDNYIDQLYKDDITFSKVIIVFTVVAILLVCMGLLSHIIFTTQQEMKSIGIRKTIGAAVTDILILYFKRYFKLTVIALIIACPLAYFSLEQWLQNFAYRNEIGFKIFLFTGISSLLIVGGTIFWQCLRAALVNPVEILKHD